MSALNDWLKGWKLRAARSLAVTVIGLLVADLQNDPKYLGLIPVLQAGAKYLRDKWPGKFEWLPI